MKMKDAADEVAKGNYSTRLDSYTKDEIGELSAAFNHMSESIQKEDERKKEFLANVSHELRTPISYVKGYSDALVNDMIHNEQDRKQYLHLFIGKQAGWNALLAIFWIYQDWIWKNINLLKFRSRWPN